MAFVVKEDVLLNPEVGFFCLMRVLLEPHTVTFGPVVFEVLDPWLSPNRPNSCFWNLT
jgi:hypothetical protein